jgi:hypothetical protein
MNARIINAESRQCGEQMFGRRYGGALQRETRPQTSGVYARPMRGNYMIARDKSHASPGVSGLDDKVRKPIRMHATAIEAHNGSQRLLRVLATAPANDAPSRLYVFYSRNPGHGSSNGL